MSTHLTVTGTEMVTPVLRRVWFSSADLSAFTQSSFTDRYLKLVFPKDGVDYPEPLDIRSLRGLIPAQDMPSVRTYTALFPDVEQGRLAIDFVVHGDEGVAGPWAGPAPPRGQLLANRPRGADRPDPPPAGQLRGGDESALPAITAALSDLPQTAVARVVVLVDSAAYEPALPLAAGAEVTFVHREDGAGSGNALLDAVRAMSWLPGRVHAFVHGEAEQVMHGIRPHLFTERQISREQVSISGYWRMGRSEEGFRQWKSQLAEAEGGSRR